MNSEYDVSLVIPARNEAKYIESCLLHAIDAFAQTNMKYELIVVVAEWNDKTVDIAKKYDCKIVINTKLGAGSARNAGVSAAQGELLGFVDADCLVDSRWMQLLREYFVGRNDVVAVGTKISSMNGKQTWVEKSIYLMNQRRKYDEESDCYSVKWLGTSNIVMRRINFLQAGCFDENLLTCEDYDLCGRLSRYGNLLIDKRIFTIHLRESKTLGELYQRELFRGQDSLKQWMKSRSKLYDLPSVLLPAVFILSLYGMAIALFINKHISIILAIVVVVCTIIKVLRSSEVLNQLSCIYGCCVVSFVYYYSRGIALLRESYAMITSVASKQ